MVGKLDRKLLMDAAVSALNRKMGLYSTDAQIQAGAKKMVDMAIAQARKGPQRDDL